MTPKDTTKDHYRYLQWLFQAKKRYGLIILDYVVTSNHIHLLVQDAHGPNVIPRSIQLVAGRVGQEFNNRKKRKGAFWEDRYHATAIETGEHLLRCIVYMDLNMVRAGVVNHPRQWAHGGYNEKRRSLDPKHCNRSQAFIETVKNQMRSLAIGRHVRKRADGFALRETQLSYNAFIHAEKSDIAGKNLFNWKE